MYTALNRLGFRTYHMFEAVKNPTRDLVFWREGIELKLLHTGNIHHEHDQSPTTTTTPDLPYARPEFDKLLGAYAATCDIPMALFPADLATAYPTALVLLTVRSPTSWARSVAASAGVVLNWRCWAVLRHFDRAFVAPWLGLARALGRYLGVPDWRDEAGLVAAYEAHVAEVRRVVPPERLLVFGAEEAGGCGYAWEPLCEFLGVEVPPGGEAYPRMNDAEGFIEAHLMMRNVAIAKMVAQLAVPVAGVCWWWWRMRR